MIDDSMTRRLEDATASERRSRTGYIERSEMCSDAPNPPVSRLEDDTSDACQVATSSRFVEGEPLYPRVPLRSAPPVKEVATSSRFHRLIVSSSHRFIVYDPIGRSSYDTVNWKMVVVPFWMLRGIPGLCLHSE